MHWNKKPRLKEAAASRKQEHIQRDLQEDFRDGDHKTIFCQTSKHQGLDIVEGSAPSKTEEGLIAALAQEKAEMWEHRPL
jgi:hypothetical protein